MAKDLKKLSMPAPEMEEELDLMDLEGEEEMMDEEEPQDKASEIVDLYSPEDIMAAYELISEEAPEAEEEDLEMEEEEL